MEHQQITSLTAIDLLAAFDTVDHDTLLSILKSKHGITGSALKWFNAYLRPRSFKVVTEGVYSKEKDLTVSVPQGSCASAAIFNLYCSPLEDIEPENLHLSGFVDDHSVRNSFPANNRQLEIKAKEQVQECMLKIKQWMDQVHLKMNPARTEFIYFGHPTQLTKCSETSTNIAGDSIIRATSTKYLGVNMDANLMFKLHITKKYQNAMLNFFKIKSIRHLLTINTTTCLVLSLCLSHLDYCNSMLYGLPAVTIAKMQRIQNMCARLVLRKGKYDSITQTMYALHLAANTLPYRLQNTYTYT